MTVTYRGEQNYGRKSLHRIAEINYDEEREGLLMAKIDLYYSLKSPYRKNAIWVLNDGTVRAIRKLKDQTGQYLWQPGLRNGEPDMLLGKPLYTSAYMPIIAAGAKTIMFGDLSYYWIGDRKGITFKRLNERYADYGQIGFLASKRVDGKLILPEAVKALQMKST